MGDHAQLRRAEPSDYDRIIDVVDDWWGRPVRSVLPRLFLDHFHRTSFVAEDRGELTGFLIGFLSGSDDESAYVHFAGVAPRARGGGLARRLYEHFFDLVGGAGRVRVRAITTPHNHGSIAFHRALGFAVRGPIPDHNGPGADRVLFSREVRAT
ncbi:GNAT family N-acetyltransferase [Saccharopolyspora rhizosphaerae]|uniref:GNAT family N-acetyltransferase n=1 Tax=Saccharopolyspora rhizosphaerae TaxID=2492662 RepID=A0A426JPH6_9PSEU|nr:GNAT family N-acetyltransferase [Saccharopolyspora rhizosphaerae]RRO15133.1 GNAT family N-acetyltransferase [Saccharopolyspora rhizosphaerae]